MLSIYYLFKNTMLPSSNYCAAFTVFLFILLAEPNSSEGRHAPHRQDFDSSIIELAPATIENNPANWSPKKNNHHKKKVPVFLQETVDKMWAADSDSRIPSSAIKLNWGKQLERGQIGDLSADPLFEFVDESVVMAKPIYAALANIYKQNLFHEPVCIEEPSMSDKRHQKFSEFTDLVFGSEVFRIAYDYLDKLNKTGGDFDSFCQSLFSRWFGLYSRCESSSCNGRGQQRGSWHGRCTPNSDEFSLTLGSSGWEHVFAGELNQKKTHISQRNRHNPRQEGKHYTGIVEGQHIWLRYYLLERAGQINYHGYFVHWPREDRSLGEESTKLVRDKQENKTPKNNARDGTVHQLNADLNDGNSSNDQDYLIATLQYSWQNNYLKKIGGFFVGTSPAFDFSLFTLCVIAHPGNEKCQFQILGQQLAVTSFNGPCGSSSGNNDDVHSEKCLLTSYPIMDF